VDIIFCNNRIRKKCLKASGKLKQRLDDLRAVDNLADAQTLPGRCHPLKANRKGQWAMDIEHPDRLIFEPAAPPDVSEDGWVDTAAVTAIRVLDTGDYHD
jgi:plasmid maintenance system killer protein